MTAAKKIYHMYLATTVGVAANNTMTKHEIDIHNQYLTFVGRNDEGDLEWVGTREEWDTVNTVLSGEEWIKDRIADIQDKLSMLDRHDREYDELWEELQELKSHA